jgi:hypothetical protein
MTRSKSNFGRLVRFGLIAVGLAMLWTSAGVSQQAAPITYAGSQTPPLMERQREIALALSACPASVAGKAGVYVLEKAGYVKVRESENGFTAIVGHALPNSIDPQCMNAEGARTHLPPMLKIAELRAQGKSAEEIKRTMAEAYAKGVFPQPTVLGVDYMLSTENMVPSFKGGVAPYPPHVMFFVPGMTNAELGADITIGPSGNPSAAAFVVNEGTPQAMIIVPVEVHTESGKAPDHKHASGSL